MRISDWSSDVCSSDLLVPMNRGILSTIYVREKDGPDALHAVLAKRYADEPFVKVMKPGQTPATRQVGGSNYCFIGVATDRRPGRAIAVSARSEQHTSELQSLMSNAYAVFCLNK